MKKMFNIRYRCIAVLAVMLAVFAPALKAQDDFNRAYIIMQNRGDLDSARFYIDRHMKLETSQKDADSWYLTGFIYKTISSQREANNPQSPSRNTAYDAFVKSYGLASDTDNVKRNRENIISLANRYYNDAVRTLDTVRYNVAIDCYKHYREAMLFVEPKFDITVKDNEFNLALGSTYTTLYNVNRKARKPFLELAKESYMLILKVSPNNLGANYNLGILYYNEACEIYNNMDWEDLAGALADQDSAVVIFKRSLPYMDKAYHMDEQRYETVRALANIHKGLLEDTLAKQYEGKVRALAEPRYKEAVAQGDELFKAGKYAEAREFYVRANYYMPDEEYPKTQMSVCEKKLKGE